MKRIPLLFAMSVWLISCGSGDKTAQLEKLKKESTEINEKIKTLEAELAAADTSADILKLKDVAVRSMTSEIFKHYIDVQGRIEGDQNVAVSGRMAGTVDLIHVRVGDEVREGQILAELDNSVLIQSLEELNTALNFANQVYTKQKNLWDQKIGTEIQYLTARNNKEALEAKVATLKEQMELSKMKSPINGIVDAVDLKVGQAVMPGMPLIRVVNLSNLKAKAEISETYASKVRKGNEVMISLPDIGKEIPSTIYYTTRVIDPTTRTFRAEAELGSGSQDYRPNMIAVLRVVDYQNDSAMVIPLNYIQHSGTSDYVYVASDQNGSEVATRRNIEVGMVYNGQAEIIKGLNTNDKLITSGYLDVIEGTLINY